MDIRLSLASHSYIYPLGIAEDILVEVAEHVYPVDFVILDIKEDEKRPFILGTPFLNKAKRDINNDIDPIAPTMTVNRLVLVMGRKDNTSLEREIKSTMEEKNFKVESKAHLLVGQENSKCRGYLLSTWMAFGGNTRDLGSFGEETYEITDLHQILEEVLLTERGDGVTSIKRHRLDLFSDGVWNLETASGRGRLKEDLESSM
ncbi:hypothetical protein Tco_1319187 [Tanacetum coccineum]